MCLPSCLGTTAKISRRCSPPAGRWRSKPVARYERSLIDSDAVPSLADVERLLRIKLRLDGIAAVERLKALTREPRGNSPPTGSKLPNLADSDEAWGARPGAR